MLLTPLRSLLFAALPAALTLSGLALPPSAHAAPAAETGADGRAVPAGGVSMLGDDPFMPLKVGGKAAGQVEVESVATTGQPFTRALRLRTTRRPNLPYDVQLAGSALSGVKKGDVLLATFYVRTLQGQAETGEARTEFVFERGEAPHTKAVAVDVHVPPAAKGWARFDVPFQAVEDLPAALARVSFRLGYDPQAFEIGGIRLLNYGSGTVTVQDLPRTRVTYPGIEADAPWRREAEARIERIRKGDLTVIVKDARGRPVKDARVAVRMKRHAFGFGSAVAAEGLLADTPDGAKYRETIQRLFNRVVMENDLKWPNWEANSARARKGVDWLRERGIEVRGHNLVWPGWRWLPKDLPQLKDDKAALAKRVDDHIVDVTQEYAGKLVEWDVINEPYANHDLMDLLGQEAMVRWFQLARKHDKKAVLFLNDYPPLDGGDPKNPHLNHFYQTIGYLKEKGAPIGGIGFQGHFGGSLVPPARILSGLDRFAAFGLPIAITEFDINTRDEELQAAYTRDFMTAVFSHLAAGSIMVWGFWEGRHWLPDAALFRKDWSIKPNGQAWQDLVFKKWWTEADGATSARGEYRTHGFLGDYEIRITAPGGKEKTLKARLTKGGTVVAVTLP